MRPRFTQDFAADFAQIVTADEPFALSRFHDGEYALLNGIDYDAKSGWSVDGPSWLQFSLQESLLEDPGEGYYVGISPPCDSSEAAAYYRKELKLPKSRITFATVFQQANYKKVGQLLRRFRNPILVACKNADVMVPENGVRKSWDIDRVVKQLLQPNPGDESRPIFVAAGPCANVIIHRYWKQQDPEKRVTIIDIGSALDESIHGRATRRFHEVDSSERNHVCGWEDWKPYQPLTGERREKAVRRQAHAQVFQQLHENGFKGTTGSKEQNTMIRRPADGVLGSGSGSVRDKVTSNTKMAHVRIRAPKPK